MSSSKVTADPNLPLGFHVIVEIPMNSDPIKFEIDKQNGAICVDRFMSTAMRYPCNYGYVPRTLAPDGDPVDLLVIASFGLQPGIVLTCRAGALSRMEDENSSDNKVLAVPIRTLTLIYDKIHDQEDIESSPCEQIGHFFAHYKDLEKSKFANVGEYDFAGAALQEILDGVSAYQARGHQET